MSKWFGRANSIEELHATLRQTLFELRAGYRPNSNGEQQEVETEFEKLCAKAILADKRFEGISGEKAKNLAALMVDLTILQFQYSDEQFKKFLEKEFDWKAS